MGSPSGIQPDISLGIKVPQAGGTNALSMVGDLATIQNRLNQNALFQQEFSAKQRAGQIIASSPDLESGLTALYQDPRTAAFAGPIVNNVRATQLTQMQIAHTKQEMMQSGLQAVLHGIGASLNNPDQLEANITANLGVVPKEIAPEVRSAVGSIVQGLGHDLLSDPILAAKELQKRTAGLMTSTGYTPESIAAASGTILPRVETGPYGPGGAQAPAAIGGLPGVPANVPGTVNALGGNAALTAAVAPVQGLPPAQEAYLKDRGTKMAQYQTELDDSVKTGNNLMQTIQEAKEAQQNFKPGGGAGTYAHIAQIAQAFGAPNEMVDKIANGDLSASQEFGKIANNFVMGQLRQSLQGVGGSRINQQEFEAFTKNNPNLETDPRAIDKIFNYWSRQHNYNVAEQEAMNEYLQKPGADITRWPAEWQKIAKSKGMVNTSVPEAGGQRPAASGPAATHQYIPGKGLVPVGQPAVGPSYLGPEDIR